jgi:PPOX class probable F420-dependent enzyme
MALSAQQVQERLAASRNIWFASVRASGAPHLIPIWFVAHHDHIYICTAPDSVKVRNLRRNPHVALALEDGSVPVILEGTAVVMVNAAAPAEVIAMFKLKYDWDILTSEQYCVVVEVTPTKTLSWQGA